MRAALFITILFSTLSAEAQRLEEDELLRDVPHLRRLASREIRSDYANPANTEVTGIRGNALVKRVYTRGEGDRPELVRSEVSMVQGDTRRFRAKTARRLVKDTWWKVRLEDKTEAWVGERVVRQKQSERWSGLQLSGYLLERGGRTQLFEPGFVAGTGSIQQTGENVRPEQRFLFVDKKPPWVRTAEKVAARRGLMQRHRKRIQQRLRFRP